MTNLNKNNLKKAGKVASISLPVLVFIYSIYTSLASDIKINSNNIVRNEINTKNTKERLIRIENKIDKILFLRSK